MKIANKTILEYISAIAARMPDVVALLYNDSCMTYRELDETSNRLANYLIAKGVGPESVVGIAVDRSFELLISVLGIVKAGAAYLHIDKSHPAERIQYVLNAANAKLIIAKSSNKIDLQDCNVERINIDELLTLETYSTITPSININPYSLINVIFTSGSTGRPKGVGVHHAGFLNRLLWMQNRFSLSVGDRVLQKTPLSFDVSGWELFWPLMFGATIVIPDQDAHKDPYELIDIMEKTKVTLVQFVPTMLQSFISCLNGKKLPSLKTMIAGGEALTSSLYYQVQNDLGIYVHNLYGPTEATIDVTSFSNDIEVTGATAPIGRAIDNTEIYLLDKNLEPVKDGEIGEIYIVGVGLARGYNSRPDLTAEIFIANPFRTTNSFDNLRMYKTGDLAKIVASGNIEYLGRVDSQVKIKGFRIELEEIQNVLNSHAAIANAVILAKDNEHNIKQLVAYVETKESLKEEDLLIWCRKYLPDYMVPSHVIFLDAIPLTANGKVDKEKLLAITVVSVINTKIQPQTELENKILDIWKEVLRQPNIGVTDNFFRVGGDSIVAIQAVTKGKKVDINFTVDKIFKYPTVRELSLHVNDADSKLPPVENGILVGNVGLTSIQQWFFNLDLLEPSCFSQTQLFLCKNVELKHLQHAWNLILCQHDCLRMIYHRKDNEWYQTYGPNVSLTINEIDYTKYPLQELAAVINEYSECQRKKLDPSKFPVLLSLIRCNDGIDRLLISAHHLIMDGVSWRILIEDLQELYNKSLNKLDINLPCKTHSFRQWQAQLMEFSKKISCSEMEYWDAVEKNVNNIIPDKEQINLSKLAIKQISLNSSDTEHLLNNVTQVHSSHINDILLTALTLALGDVYGKYAASFVLEGHGREDVIGLDVTRTIGWFTSLFPVNLQVSSPDDISKSIYEIKNQLALIPNKGIGYGLLRKNDLKLIPQILFNYLGKWDDDQDTSFTLNNEWILNDGFKSESEAVCLLNINCSILKGKLEVFISYSSDHFYSHTIDALSQAYISNLRKIILHSSSAFKDNANVEAVYPLTPLQEGFLFYKLYKPTSSVYYVQNIIEISGLIDPRYLKNAWQKIIDRHDVLRTAFKWENLPQPVQYVLKQVANPFRYVDISASNNYELDLQSIIDNDRNENIDLSCAPLMRVALVKIDINKYIMLWGAHHIITDGWSSANILEDLFIEYKCIVENRHNIKNILTPYRQYISVLQKQPLSEINSFWRKYLSGLNEISRIFSHGSQLDAFSKTVTKKEIPKELLSKIFAFAKNNNLTLNTIFFGVLGLLVRKYSKSDDILIGMTLSGRSYEISDIDKMTGLFINTVPIRVNMQSIDILSYFQQIQIDIRSADRFSSVSLSELQSLSGFSQGLFEIIYMHENYPTNFNAGNKEFIIKNHKVIEQNEYPLGFVVERGDVYHVRISHDATIFNQTFVNNFIQHFLNSLYFCVQQAQEDISKLDFLTPSEIKYLSVGSNPNKTQPVHGTVVSLINKQLDLYASCPAISYKSKTISYEQLNFKTNQIASYIKSNLSIGSVVGLYLESPMETILCMLGALKAGVAYLPIDINLPKDRVNLILNASDTKFIISDAKLIDTLNSDHFNILDFNNINGDDKNLNLDFHFDNLAYVIYTSGSTGTPKGVMVTNNNLYNYVLGLQEKLSLNSRTNTMLVSSLAADLGYTSIFSALTTGGCLFICDDNQKLDGSFIASAIKNHQIDLLKITPSHFRVLSECDNEIFPNKYLVFGGELLDKEILGVLKNSKKSFSVYNHYGPTETTVGCCAFKVDYNQDYINNVPIGTTIGANQAYILDQELNLMPAEVPGYLYITGSGVSRGYINLPSHTAESYVANPFVSVSEESNIAKLRLYKTGDVAKLLFDGSIEYIERKDTQVKIRGYRVELFEITNAIRNRDDVYDAVTITVKNQSAVTEIVSFVVFKISYAGQEQRLKAHLTSVLPNYMVPDLIHSISNIPLNANGKIDFIKLSSLNKELKSKIINQSINPSSINEIKIHQLWSDLLGLEHIDVNASFFNIGGHSLLSIKLVNSINKAFNSNYKVGLIFENPTIQTLAKAVEGRDLNADQKENVLVAQKRESKIPLSFAQQRLWIMYQLFPEVALYNMPSCFKIIEKINTAALEKTVNTILKRHDLLTSSIVEEEGIPYQISVLGKEFSLHDNTVKLLDSEVAEYIASLVNRPINIYKDDLFQIKYISTMDNGGYILFNLHHIISDAWSLSILFNEFSELYNAYASGNFSFRLPNKFVDYFDYCIFERKSLSSNHEQIQYWQKTLHNLPLTCTIPSDYERPEELLYQAKRIHFDLKTNAYNKLLLLAKTKNISIFMIMTAVLQTAIYKYTGQEDIIIGTPVANRDIQNCDDIIGLFVNTIPLICRFNDSDNFDAVLSRTKDTILSALHHKDVSFDSIVDSLSIPRAANIHPIYQIMLVYTQEIEVAKLNLQGVSVLKLDTQYNIAKYDFVLSIIDSGDALNMEINYSSELYAEETMNYFVSFLQKLVTILLADSAISIGDICMIESEEYHFLTGQN